MARIRSVHPGLFTDEDFVMLQPLERLLLIGIWTECDDQGVFMWKPSTLKMRLFPVDNADVAQMLGSLERIGAVRRFEDEGQSYGAVKNFRKFQNPERPNAIYPLPDELRTWVQIDTKTKPGSRKASPAVGGRGLPAEAPTIRLVADNSEPPRDGASDSPINHRMPGLAIRRMPGRGNDDGDGDSPINHRMPGQMEGRGLGGEGIQDSPPAPPQHPAPRGEGRGGGFRSDPIASNDPSLRGVGRGEDKPRPLWVRELIRGEEGTGREVCNGYYWDSAVEQVRAAARLPERWQGSWEPLARWLCGGADGNPPRDLPDIIAAITKVVGKNPAYEAPVTLQYFNRPVWEYNRRRARGG